MYAAFGINKIFYPLAGKSFGCGTDYAIFIGLAKSSFDSNFLD